MACKIEIIMKKIAHSEYIDRTMLEAYIKQELNGGAKTSITAEQRGKNANAVKKLLGVNIKKKSAQTKTTGFQGYVGGFDSKGKGTVQGDGKDKAMRKAADGFIGEIVKTTPSSTSTSHKVLSTNESISENFGKTTVVLGTTVDNSKVIMLARNSGTDNELQKYTKDIISRANNEGATFVVGDMPGVDSQFIDYLDEIGASYKIYHTGVNPRIKKETEPKRTINIYHGTNENAELSNFAIRPFNYKEVPYVSVEQFFQDAKFNYVPDTEDNRDIREKILNTSDGAEMKRLGGTFKRLDTIAWNKAAEGIMAIALVHSFEQNPEALKKLLATGDAELTHTQDKGKWGTKFPELLMKTREKLRDESANGKTTVKVVKDMNDKTPDTDTAVNVLRKYGAEKDKHYGNPFGTNYAKGAEVPNQGTDEQVSQKYEDWLKGTKHQDVSPERRKWIIAQIKNGELDGKELMYFRDAGDNHAKRLADLVNDKSWIKNAVNSNNNNNRFIDNFISPEDLYIYDSDNIAYDDEGEQINITHANNVKWFNNIIDKLGLPEDVVSIMKETLPLLNGIPASSELAPRAEATKKLDKFAKFILNRLLSPNEQILWNNLEKLYDLGGGLLMALDVYKSHPEYKKTIEEYFKMFKSIYGSTETDKLKTVLKSKNLDLINSTLLKYDSGLTETYQNKFKYKEFLFTEAGDLTLAIASMGDAISVAFRLVSLPEISDTKGTNTEYHKLNRKVGEDLAKRRAKFLNLFIQVMQDTTNKKSAKPIDTPTNEQYERELTEFANKHGINIKLRNDTNLAVETIKGNATGAYYKNGVVHIPNYDGILKSRPLLKDLNMLYSDVEAFAKKSKSWDNKTNMKVHEIWHALTVDYLDSWKSVGVVNKKDAKLAKELDQELEALFEMAKKQMGAYNPSGSKSKDGKPYWHSNSREFLAVALAEPKMLEKLNTIKYEGNVTLAQKILSTLFKIIEAATGIKLDPESMAWELIRIADASAKSSPKSNKVYTQPSKIDTLESELTDTMAIVGLLGIKANTNREERTPTLNEVLNTQSEMLEAVRAQDVSKVQKIVDEAKWLRTTDTETSAEYIADRVKRASSKDGKRSGANKVAKGSKEEQILENQYLMFQVIEELNEVADQLDISKEVREALREQKELLKVTRFGANTEIKDGNGGYLKDAEGNNLTNLKRVQESLGKENVNVEELIAESIDKLKGEGKAKTVLINSLLQSEDTLPHEYAHHYIAMFRDAPIVQEAIKKWGSEEALVQAIGEQVVEQKGEALNWWYKFVNWVLGEGNHIRQLDADALKDVLTEAFLSNINLHEVYTGGYGGRGMRKLFDTLSQYKYRPKGLSLELDEFITYADMIFPKSSLRGVYSHGTVASYNNVAYSNGEDLLQAMHANDPKLANQYLTKTINSIPIKNKKAVERYKPSDNFDSLFYIDSDNRINPRSYEYAELYDMLLDEYVMSEGWQWTENFSRKFIQKGIGGNYEGDNFYFAPAGDSAFHEHFLVKLDADNRTDNKNYRLGHVAKLEEGYIEAMVTNPEQIHIFGSDKDIEMLQRWKKTGTIHLKGRAKAEKAAVDNDTERIELHPGEFLGDVLFEKGEVKTSNAIMPGINGKAKLDIKIC